MPGEFLVASEVLITTIVVQLDYAHSGNSKPFHIVMRLRRGKRIVRTTFVC